jgi:hypothetical protein
MRHWQVTRFGEPWAWCYPGKRLPIEAMTTDTFAVTCGKCQRSKRFKATAAAAFAGAS